MEPDIVDARGIEVEIVLWRDTNNLFEAQLSLVDGNPLNLSDRDVTMTIVDRAGGTVRYTQTNTPEQHTDAANGITRFSVPSSTFDGLTGQRAYTWKHHVVTTDRATGTPVRYFYGDVRVQAPPSEVA